MVNNKHTKRYNTQMTGTDKTDYKVPSFLIKELESIPDKDEFYNTYAAEKDEIPLWWTRDVDLPLTKKENRRAGKRAIAIKNTLEQQRIKTEHANQRFLKIIEKQQKEHKKRCQLLDQQVLDKKEELAILDQQNKLLFQNKLLELELDLQQTNAEKVFYEKQKQKLNEIEEMNMALLEEQQERQSALAAVDEDITKEKEYTKEIKNDVNNERAKKGLSPLSPPIEQIEEVEEQNNETDTEEINLEAYDSKNIMEIKRLTIVNKETGLNEINSASFNIKKQGTTIVFSNYDNVIKNIYAAIRRTLPQKMLKTAGEIRLLGKSIYQINIEHYKNKIKNFIVSQKDIEKTIATSTKKISSLFKSNRISEKKSIKVLNLLNLDKKIYNKKADKLDITERKKLSIIIALLLDTPFILLYQPEEEISDQDKKGLVNILNTQKHKAAVLIFTKDKYLSGAILDSALYTFNKK